MNFIACSIEFFDFWLYVEVMMQINALFVFILHVKDFFLTRMDYQNLESSENTLQLFLQRSINLLKPNSSKKNAIGRVRNEAPLALHWFEHWFAPFFRLKRFCLCELVKFHFPMDGKQLTKECRLNHLYIAPNVKRKIYDLWRWTV